MKIWIPIRKEYGPIAQAKELIHTTVGVKQPDVYDRCSYRSDGGGMRIDSWKIICLAFADRLWLVLEKSRGDVSLVEQDTIECVSIAYLKFIFFCHWQNQNNTSFLLLDTHHSQLSF